MSRRSTEFLTELIVSARKRVTSIGWKSSLRHSLLGIADWTEKRDHPTELTWSMPSLLVTPETLLFVCCSHNLKLGVGDSRIVAVILGDLRHHLGTDVNVVL